jgi:hypothetical protein
MFLNCLISDFHQFAMSDKKTEPTRLAIAKCGFVDTIQSMSAGLHSFMPYGEVLTP